MRCMMMGIQILFVNQGHRSNLWFTGDVSSWWTVWRVWAPAVTLLIPHSLYLFSRSVMTAFFFYFIAFCMSSSHSICPFSHSCHCLSLSPIALWTQMVQWTKPVWRKKMISRIIRLISYMQHNESIIRAVHMTHALYFRSSEVRWQHWLRNRSLVT